MDLSKDYEDLFKILNAYQIKYLVVGAYAVMSYTEPRYTKDIDVWIIPDLNNVNKIHDALKEFGAPLYGLDPEDFKDKKMILQMGVPPVRIDIMINLPGVSFAKAWKNKKKIRYNNTPIYVLGREELLQSKKKAGRPQDLIDLEKLERTKKS